jgi:hypothetical protein
LKMRRCTPNSCPAVSRPGFPGASDAIVGVFRQRHWQIWRVSSDFRRGIRGASGGCATLFSRSAVRDIFNAGCRRAISSSLAFESTAAEFPTACNFLRTLRICQS